MKPDASMVLRHEPAEAVFLGLPDAGHWARHDGASLAAEATWCDALVSAAADDTSDLDHDERALLRWARWRRYAIRDAAMHEVSLEGAFLPVAAWQFELLHGVDQAGRERMVARVEDLPRYLDQMAANLVAGQRRGRDVAWSTVEAVATREWPGCVAFLADDGALATTLGARATAALTDARRAAQRFGEVLKDTLLPSAGAPPTLSAESVAFRLQETMGVTQSPRELVAVARERLNEIRSAVAALTGADTTQGIAAAVAGVMATKVATTDAITPLYRRHVDHAVAVLDRVAPGLLPSASTTHVDLAPQGLPHAANWPAPLARPSGNATFFVGRQPEGHVVAWAADLAVHEAIPGHGLQSLVWQTRFGGSDVPARCLFMSDPVAIAHHFWGAMVNIEGWAVYAEGWMRDEGLFTPNETLCVWVSDAIRYARLVVDLSLNLGWMTEDAAVSFIVEHAFVSEGLARGEVMRYRRIPLQSSTYAIGLEGIRSLQAAWKGPSDFHAWFLAQGPVPPGELA
ncbi:MAG: hypothetical protein ACI9MR_000714 [Myxococcota bacterium]|jgi:uncharacterized protein (DUF885 family)